MSKFEATFSVVEPVSRERGWGLRPKTSPAGASGCKRERKRTVDANGAELRLEATCSEALQVYGWSGELAG